MRAINQELEQISIPSWSPASSLRGHSLGSARHHHVQWSETGNTSDAEGEELRGAGLGDSDGHVEWLV